MLGGVGSRAQSIPITVTANPRWYTDGQRIVNELRSWRAQLASYRFDATPPSQAVADPEHVGNVDAAVK